MRRALLAAVTAVVTAGSALSGGQGAGAAHCAGQLDQRYGASGEWSTYRVPAFSVGPAEPTAHATDADRWFVTNGLVVAASTDRGCTWAETLVLPESATAEMPAARDTSRIRSLAAAGGAVAATVAVLSEVRPLDALPEDPLGAPVTATLVLWGTDALAATAPLTVPLGAPGPLVLSPLLPRTVHVVAGGRLHTSTDGGQSWALSQPAPQDPAPVTTFGIHPRLGTEVYAVQGSSLYRKAGPTWDAVLTTDGGVLHTPVVTVDENQPRRVRVLESVDAQSAPHTLHVAEQDGSTFRPRATGARDLGDVSGAVQASWGGPRLDQFVFTTASPVRGEAEVFSYDLSLDGLVAVDEFDLGPLQDPDLSGSAYAFRSATRLVRWVPGARLATLPRRVNVGPIEAPLPPLSPETVLTGPTAVSLARDETTDLALDLSLTAEPTPIDVFFLLDTSGSMDDVVNGLANGFAGLAEELGRQRIDAHFGLGEYQDTAGTRFARLVDISPPGEPLRRALNRISTAGGTEPAWTALHQLSTGTGIREPDSGDPVPAGQAATWRRGSLRVVVHATDEVPSDDPSGATRDQAVRALRDDGALHVGLEVLRDRSTTSDVVNRDVVGVLDRDALYRALAAVSRGTGALAPAGGVDCDGDGQVDVPPGAPLVCRLVPPATGPLEEPDPEAAVELADPLLRILATLRDEQPVGVDVSPPSAARDLRATVRSLSEVTTVNVKEAAALAYGLTLTCAPQAYGRTLDLALRPAVGARTGTALPLRVACQGLPPGAVPPAVAGAAPQPPSRPVAAALPGAPVPPPAPANAPAPAQVPAPAALPAGASAVNPVVGLGLSPEEQQAEIALAEQEAAGLDLAMSAVDQRPDTAALRLLPLLAVTSAAAVVARRRREQLVRTRA